MVFCFVDLLADGALNPAFDGPGGSGNGLFLLPAQVTAINTFADAELLRDGRVVVAGSCGAAWGDFDPCLARLMPDGTLDPTFDGPSGTGNGAFMDSISPGPANMYSLELQSDDAMLVAGGCSNGTNDDACFARYTSVGARDTTFDGPGGSGNGSFLIPVGAGADSIRSVAAAEDGRIVAGGSCVGGSNADFCLMHLANGGTVSQYVTGGGADRDWSSGPSTGMFGACLRAVSGGAAATWPTTGSCTVSDGPVWRALSGSFDQVATTAAPEPDPVDATASLRFGMRPALDQPPGRYVAPIVFEVLAPAA